MRKRGFRTAKTEALVALRSGLIQHEPREALDEKNLLATGDVDADFVITLIDVTTSREASASAHHFLDVQVWTFMPTVDAVRWYVKFYLIDSLWFISVHKSEAMIRVEEGKQS